MEYQGKTQGRQCRLNFNSSQPRREADREIFHRFRFACCRPSQHRARELSVPFPIAVPSPRFALLWAALLLVAAVAVLPFFAWPASAQSDSPPDRPARPTAGAVSHGSITFSWADPGDSSITGYQVLRRNRDTDAVGDLTTIEEDTGTDATTYTDDTVAPSTRYTYRVKARNADGLSPRSKSVRATTPPAPVPPAAPTGLTAQDVTHESVTLTWDPPNDHSITSYRILRRERDAGTELQAIVEDTGSAANTYMDDTVEPETVYEYRVKAINNDGVSEQSNSAQADTAADPTPPAGPANLAADPTHNRVTLTWDDPEDDGITGYQVLRGPDGDTLETIVENTDSADTQYVDEGVQPETTYAYGVRAINGVGASEQSGVVEVVTLAVPVEVAPP